LKTIDDFDFTFQSTLRMSMLGTYLSPDFVTDGRNVVLYGKPGRGKTHLAIAVAYRAIQNGFTARLVTAAALIDELAAASRRGEMKGAIAGWVHPHVLVIDEMAYLAYGTDAANLLFHVVNEHLERRSMIVTTNKPLNSWGKVLHDPDLGEAIVDRILERGSVLRLDGPSVRSRHVDPKDLDGPDPVGSEPAIISGSDRPEFPEPALVTDVTHLQGECPLAGLSELIEEKRRGEKSELPEDVALPWKGRVEALFSALDAAQASSVLPAEPKVETARALEDWLLNLRRRHFWPETVKRLQEVAPRSRFCCNALTIQTRVGTRASTSGNRLSASSHLRHRAHGADCNAKQVPARAVEKFVLDQLRKYARGTTDCELAAGLDVHSTDSVLVKKRYSAFFGTDFDARLAQLAPSHLVLARVNT
jgi:hypothetical protein